MILLLFPLKNGKRSYFQNAIKGKRLTLYSLTVVRVMIQDIGETGSFPTQWDLNLRLSSLRKVPYLFKLGNSSLLQVNAVPLNRKRKKLIGLEIGSKSC